MTLIENADYFLRVVPFPTQCRCGAMTMLNDDGTYSIYINANMPQKEREAMEHELRHIINNDFYNGLPIWAIENI